MYENVIRKYKDIAADYTWDCSIWNAEPERTSRLKEIVNTKLSQVDKIIFLLYVDCQSLRKLGRRLGLSHMTVRKEVERIKTQIRKEYDGLHS